jgi:uncharacterized membrane protein
MSVSIETGAGYARLARLCSRVVWGSYLGLLLAIALATLVIPSGGRAPNPTVWLILSVPLLIFLPGLWRGRVMTHAWLCFVSMLYFAMAVTNLAVPHWRLLDVVELMLSVALFGSALLFVRWRSRALRGEVGEVGR